MGSFRRSSNSCPKKVTGAVPFISETQFLVPVHTETVISNDTLYLQQTNFTMAQHRHYLFIYSVMVRLLDFFELMSATPGVTVTVQLTKKQHWQSKG